MPERSKPTEKLHFFLVWLALGLLPLFMRPLWQPDEGRYAEIPREMLESGNWLTPHLNYVLYFEKPPFQYWLSAISMKAFGESAAAARLPLAFALLLTMWAVWRLSKRLGCQWPTWAAFAAASSLLLFVCGQVLTLDALFSALCFFSAAAAVEAVSLRYYDGGRWQTIGWTLAFFVGASCATLTKGPAAVVLVGGAIFFSLFVAWKDAKLRAAIFKTFFSPYGWLMFAAITVPWFVLVNRANPGHAHFFFYTEHIERFLSHRHERQGSDNPILDKLFFVPIILVGLVPWLSSCFVGMKRALRFIGKKAGPTLEGSQLNKWVVALLVSLFAWPLLFFSASGSKLVPYVLPCVAPIIVLGAVFQKESDGFLPMKRLGVEMLLLGAIFFAAAAVAYVSPMLAASSAEWVSDIQQYNGALWLLFLGLGFSLAGAWAAKSHELTTQMWMAWHSALLIILVFAAQRVNGAQSTIDGLIANVPHELRGKGKIQWISHGDYFQALPFLVKDRVTIVGATGELYFGRDNLPQEEQGRWFVEDRQALTETGLRLKSECPDKPIWALSTQKAWRTLPEESQTAWEVVDASSPRAVLLRFVGQ
ncbi:MAG: phospholipid carrier-dependent glycosyltransferase [Holophagales bacterium]|jgi:4-amino-4-deoxy-L-arabinose transferase-like glycosyltransferase|nr:phospholipid carrier-dependent glycosyltransferase [Holophagales bacterium]